MKIAILGFGREGKSLLKFLKRSKLKADITILDQKFGKPPHQTRMGAFGTKKEKSLLWCGGKNYLKNLEKFDTIFRSPGVPYNLPEIQKAIKKGVKFSSATALFFDEVGKMVRRGSPQVIGITGTKGKGTTSSLLYKILRACGRDVYLAGNIGKPAIEILSNISVNLSKNQRKSASTIVILELSSFQLQDLKKSPNIAVVLDIFPDHMDTHKNLKEYLSAKSAISKFQNPNDKVFYFVDNKYSRLIAQKGRGKKIPVKFLLSNSRELENELKQAIKIPGEHNLKNTVMAATVALSLGCPKEKILRVVKNFRGNKHRLELVRIIKIANQSRINHHELSLINRNKIRDYSRKNLRMISDAKIFFYNDSASTNPQTAAAAIRAFKEPKILIAGGKDKSLNYSPLTQALKNSSTELVILFGENKKKIWRQIVNSKVQIVSVKNLKDTVNLAYKTAKSLIHNSNSIIHILFSPASASFDMFKDYADRGEKFKKLVRKLN